VYIRKNAANATAQLHGGWSAPEIPRRALDTETACQVYGGYVHDQIRQSIMLLLTMGSKSVHFSDLPFETQNQFQNDQFSHSNSSPRRHTNFRLRAAAPHIVAKHRRRRRRLSARCGNRVKPALKFSDNLRGSRGVFAICMGKQCENVFRHYDLGRAKSLSTRGSGHILNRAPSTVLRAVH